MRIGEALLERDHLEEHLEALGSRLLKDVDKGRPLTYLLEEIEATSSRIRDLSSALDWTLQQLMVQGHPLGSYLQKQKQLERLIKLLEQVDSPEQREKIDELRSAKKETERLVRTVYWAYDLQVPKANTPQTEREEED